MTKEEFLYEHDYALILDLISRYVHVMQPEASENNAQSRKEPEVMTAGEFLL